MKYKALTAICCLLTALCLNAQVHNLNVDWKFTKAKNNTFPLESAAKSVEKNGKPFFAVDYDDSDWAGVSVPHAVNAEDSFDDRIVDAGEAGLYRGFMFYRKHFTLSSDAAKNKVFIEFESVRQSIYLYVNGEFAGYYEAGVAPIGFDISHLVKSGDNLVAVASENTASRGIKVYTKETKPGNPPGDQSGSSHQWNQKDFNPVQGGLTGNVNLYIKSPVYLTLPLYNNLKTTGTYITASDFDLANGKATINVKAEVRNESKQAAKLTVSIKISDAATGKEVASFKSAAVSVAPAKDAGKTFATAVESDVYDENPAKTAVNTPDVQYVTAANTVSGLTFWSPDTPALYNVELQLVDDAEIYDSEKITTGFREVKFDAKQGLLINGKSYYLKGYAQRSTNEWAVIGVANDWLSDFDAALIRESGANYIRWMHVVPKPVMIRAGDKYGVVSVSPAGDKEADPKGRGWSQRVEAMRDGIIYFRNSPSILFWEVGNNAVTAEHMQEMTDLRKLVDPDGGRFMGCRTLTTKEQIAAAEWVGTMIYRHDQKAKDSMNAIGRQMPMLETEYKREESPRRVWDRYSPPDYDYVNKWLGKSGKKTDGFDIWDLTQEDFCVTTAGSKDGYAYFYGNRVGGQGRNYYSGAAMLTWADSNMHGRNSGSENSRTSGRVDPVRIPKESFYALQVYQAEEPKIKILGHWNYPQLTPETYLYREKEWTGKYWQVTDKLKQRDPKNKTVYVIGSLHCASIELFVNGKSAGINSQPKDLFIYEFPGIDVTQSGEIRAEAKDAKGKVIANDKLETVGEAAAIRLKPVTGPDGLRADGSDVMFFDVEIVDAQGRVCPLNYDRIDFKISGPGVFLGGFNSGKFGKDSVIHKSFVFAECGLNRVFIRSTRKGGEITLSATSGKLTAQASVQANAVTATDGFIPAQQAFKPGAKYAAGGTAELRETSSDNAAADTYKVFVNGQEVSFTGNTPHMPDSSTGVVCALRPVLTALEKAGAALRWTYRTDGALPAYLSEYSLPLLTIQANKKKVEIANGNTEIVVDSGKNKNLTNYQFTAENGELIGELPAVLAYIPGVEVKLDSDAKTIIINVKK